MTVEAIWTPADGAGPAGQFHATEMVNTLRALNGAGVLASTVTITTTGTTLVVTIAAFNAMVPDGSGNLVRVVYAGGTVTVTTGHATLPRTDICQINSSGTVSMKDGTPTAETGDVVEAPMVAIDSDAIALFKVKMGAAVSVVSDSIVKGRAIDVTHHTPLAKALATAVVYTTNTTFADVTDGTTTLNFTAKANTRYQVRLIIPVSMGGTGGLKLQFTGTAAPTRVRLDAFGEALVGQGQDSATANESDLIMYRRLGTITTFSSSVVALNSPTPTLNSTLNVVLGIPQAGTTIVIEGEILNGTTAGTVALQAAQNSSNSTTTLAIGTRLIVEELH